MCCNYSHKTTIHIVFSVTSIDRSNIQCKYANMTRIHIQLMQVRTHDTDPHTANAST